MPRSIECIRGKKLKCPSRNRVFGKVLAVRRAMKVGKVIILFYKTMIKKEKGKKNKFRKITTNVRALHSGKNNKRKSTPKGHYKARFSISHQLSSFISLLLLSTSFPSNVRFRMRPLTQPLESSLRITRVRKRSSRIMYRYIFSTILTILVHNGV